MVGMFKQALWISVLAFTSGCAEGPTTVSQVAESALLVAIVVSSDGGQGSAVPVYQEHIGGSAYVVAYLTAGHVVDMRGPFDVNGVQAASAYRHGVLDIGLIMVVYDQEAPPPIVPMASRLPVTGEDILAAGFYSGFFSPSRGMVGNPIVVPSFLHAWDGGYLFTSASSRGMSGGAILNLKGEVLGIVVGGRYESEHLGCFLPIQSPVIQAFLQSSLG